MVDETADEIEQRTVPANANPRGSLWTLVAAIAVFMAILFSVWIYLWPRLQGEPPSKNADLRFAVASVKPIDGWPAMKTGDQEFFVNPQSVLTADDVETFRGIHGEGGPVLRLHFTTDGAARLSQVTRDHSGELLALVINGRLVNCSAIHGHLGDQVDVTLGYLSPAEFEELLARLTQ